MGSRLHEGEHPYLTEEFKKDLNSVKDPLTDKEIKINLPSQDMEPFDLREEDKRKKLKDEDQDQAMMKYLQKAIEEKMIKCDTRHKQNKLKSKAKALT